MKETTASLYLGFFYLCTFWATTKPLSAPTDLTVPASPLGLPPPCRGPKTLCQTPRAISPCPSDATSGQVPRSLQPCLPGHGTHQDGPTHGPVSWPQPIPREVPVPRRPGCPGGPSALLLAGGGTSPGCQAFRELKSYFVYFAGFKLDHFFNLYCFLLTMGIVQPFLLSSLALSQPLRSGRSHCSGF